MPDTGWDCWLTNKKVPSKEDSTAIPFLTTGSLPSPRVAHIEALIVDTSSVFDDSPSVLTGSEKILLLDLNIFLQQLIDHSMKYRYE